jgi:hypothetical protein
MNPEQVSTVEPLFNVVQINVLSHLVLNVSNQVNNLSVEFPPIKEKNLKWWIH